MCLLTVYHWQGAAFELASQKVTLPNSDNIHALDEVCCCATIAKDQGKATVQRKAGNANVKASTNARQAMIFVSQGKSYSTCLHSHLQQTKHIDLLLAPIMHTHVKCMLLSTIITGVSSCLCKHGAAFLIVNGRPPWQMRLFKPPH